MTNTLIVYTGRVGEKIIDIIGLTSEHTILNVSVTQVLTDLDDFDQVLFIVADWNGSIPWTMKKWLDELPYPSPLSKKNCYIVGHSGGFGGNGIGTSHLQDILLRCNANILSPLVYVANDSKVIASIESSMESSKSEELDKHINPIYSKLKQLKSVLERKYHSPF